MKQSFKIIPISLLGKWSVGFIIVMPLFFIAGMSFADSLYKSVPSGETILDDIIKRPALSLTMLAGMLSGILGFISGLMAIIRKKDRSVLVYISSIIGALFVIFLIGEFLFPH